MNWTACAREVGSALSRYNGVSSRVGLDSILALATSPLFDEKSSRYAWELIGEIKERTPDIGQKAAESLLSHATVLGFLYRPVPGNATTAQFALSAQGKAYRAAHKLQDAEFGDFLKRGSLLDNDFDMYGLFLRCALEEKQGRAVEADFGAAFSKMVQERKAWLNGHASSPVIKGRIEEYTQWPGHKRDTGGQASRRGGIWRSNRQKADTSPTSARGVSAKYEKRREDLEDKSIKEHFGMRWQWARDLGHADDNKALTAKGRELAERVVGLVRHHNSMFWLAPTPECVQKVGLVFERPYGDSVCSGWDLLRPPAGSEGDLEPRMVSEVADFMESAFSTLRQRAFAQASLAAVMPYVYFQESKYGHRVEARAFFHEILQRRRGTLYCMLLGVLENSQYRRRVAS